jgi:hypothetical protein
MGHLNNNQYRALGLGAILGAATAFVAGALIMGRKHRIPGYLHQSAEGAGDSPNSIQEHDAKVFRGDLVTAKS